jgi:leucyl-tRNA synthetase
MAAFNPQAIEAKWQEFWEKNNLFQGTEQQEVLSPEDKMFILFAFAYPSGSGLHVGHVESKTALDIMSRYYRMQGKKVFFPVGWDAFGLPAENYAIKTGIHPAETTKSAINTFRRQLKRIGISYDWANEIATCHPGYYKWTQWLFLQFYKEGLAYQGTGMVNWCPSCQTVLANEQVVNGACERCGTEVIQKDMKQWFFKITKYAEELITGLDTVDWPKPTKQQQLHWIGKSQGVTYKQNIKDLNIEIEAYDSVPQTFMAQSYSVIAPEHPLVEELVKGTEYEKPVMEFVEEFKKRKVQNRFQIDKEIEGIFTGRYVENPFGTGDLPIWVSTFVIADYGSGFVNSSAHDERDFAFAKKYNIPLRPVMFPADPVEAEKVRNLEYPYHHEPQGILESPAEFKGRLWGEVREDIIAYLEKKGFGERKTQYKLRDWLISRQRYWGAPIPIVYDPEGNPHPVKEEHLPWELPTDVDFKPTGESPLRSSKEFIERTEKLYGKGWRPEFDTMDTFVDSSWYYLRYVSARDEAEFSSPEQMKKWLPVDFYMIGPEHIVLHLLYSRFFTKFLRDQGYLNFDEPFMKMRHQGMILGPDGRKMSKSKGNVINPDDVVDKFGADTLRMYEMFMGPIEADKPWDVSAVAGTYRFLTRVNNLVMSWVEEKSAVQTNEKLQRKLHQTIKKVSLDIPNLKFNTAIAALMELVNAWEAAIKEAKTAGVVDQDGVVAFVKLIAPMAPFLADELYHQIRAEATESIHQSAWPEWDEELTQEDEVNIAVQVNGKVRGQIAVSNDLVNDKNSVLAAAKEATSVAPWLEGKELVKEIYVPGKIVSFVTK